MKKIVSILLTLALVLSLCSFALADEKPVIRVAYPGNIQAFIDGEDENHNFIIDYIEEQSGVDVVWNILPNEDAQNKLNMLVVSGDVDVIFGGYQTMLDFYNNGLLAVLNDYIPESTFAADVEELTKECTFGDDVFAIFYPGGQSEATAVWMYNKQLLADAGIEVPEELTLDQFTDILYKIKEAYPDKIALTACGNGSNNMFLNGLQNIYGAFGIANAVRVTDDGSLEYTGASEDMRECIAYISKLYADGILDPEYMVNTKDTITPKLINGNIVTISDMWYDYTGTHSTYMVDENNALTNWGQVPIIHGTRATSGQTNGSKTRQIGAVTASCKNIEAAVKVLAVMSTDDYYYRIMYGVPGVDSIRDEATGKVTWLDTPVAKAYNANGTFFHNYYSVKESKALRCARLLPTYNPPERFETDIMMFYAPKEVDDPISVHPYTPEYDDIRADLDDLFAVYFGKMVIGDYSVDQFDELISEFDALGGNEAMAALTEWYKK